jgi:hypothetical protein
MSTTNPTPPFSGARLVALVHRLPSVDDQFEEDVRSLAVVLMAPADAKWS